MESLKKCWLKNNEMVKSVKNMTKVREFFKIFL